MSQKQNFLDKLTRFIVGEPVPVLSEHDLELIHDLCQRLDAFSHHLNTLPAAGQPPGPLTPITADGGEAQPAPLNVAELQEQLQKLAKTQFKTNSLQEAQLAQFKQTLDSLQQALAQQDKTLAEVVKQREQAIEAARLDLLKRIIPVLDSLDAAFNSGRRQVLQLPMNRETRQAVIAWLDGIRLARLRLLDVLAAYEVHPIPTTGQPFDPHYHVAVATDTTGRAPDGIIVGEDRPGYTSPTKVLREAEVIVARSKAS
ncbi:MAG: nucleotide exchange factor GrpE [Chloroflexi bacterium]|nr:nucleotide exchange factor GrpE [Chloroflexota bacterium]